MTPERDGWGFSAILQDLLSREPAKLPVSDLSELQTNLIELDTELVELFGLYWGRVRPPSQRGHVTYPYYYLQSEGFWH